MKNVGTILTVILLLTTWSSICTGQSGFDPDSYKSYLETNKNLTSSGLLDKYPAQTTYYSSRSHPAELSGIPWFDSIDRVFNFTSHERQLLENNFFMVTERRSSLTWLESLIEGYNNDLPLFLSTDFILYTLHNSYDNILLTLEWQVLEPNLQELLEAMYQGIPALAGKYKDDARYEDALKDVDLYISVPLSLLSGEDHYPQLQTADQYNEIMGLIEAEQRASCTLFTESRLRKIDFSQFTPRGHYTREFWTPQGKRNLENYFQAMMWLGRIDFLLTAPPSNPWEEDWKADELKRMQVGAILANELLYACGKKENLDLHEEIITYLIGPDDNLTPAELHGLTGRLLSAPGDLYTQGTYEMFRDSLNASDDYGQKIMSNFFYVDPFSVDPGQLPVSYKLLGQKFLIDSYIFSEVVFDRIVWDTIKVWRPMPDPLDAMAVLGNEDAMALMEDDMEFYKYAYKVDALKYLVDAYDDEFWDQSLYNTWLAAIRELNPASSSESLPYFMKTTAWHHEKLNTQLCSWAELRHDNLLYGKQSYTGGTACSYPFTYVEPYPEFYGRLQNFARNAAQFFQAVHDDHPFERGPFIVDYYSGFADIMESLREIAWKELAGTPISDSEVTFLKTMINSYMASGPYVTGWVADLFYDLDAGLNMDFVVADVHTQPTEYMGPEVGKVLHVGNGLINRGVFLAPNPVNPKQLMAFTGPISSFHYEITWNYKRLTDEEWKQKFLEGTLPLRPDWISEYMADPSGNALPDGRKLKGELFAETFVDPTGEMNPLDYLLAFPNPARDELHLRFVLNTRSHIQARAYDASGRLVRDIYNGQLMPAEHDIAVSLEGWPKALYFIKFTLDQNKSLTRKVLVF
jgi:hypothetical protein